jgi:hypothetical protein
MFYRGLPSIDTGIDCFSNEIQPMTSGGFVMPDFDQKNGGEVCLTMEIRRLFAASN